MIEEEDGDLTSERAAFADAWPSDLRDAILNPRNNRMTPKGEPAAKKFCTGNNKGGSFLLSLLLGIGCSSMDEVGAVIG